MDLCLEMCYNQLFQSLYFDKDEIIMHTRELTIEELQAQADEEIDYSEIPPLDENFWKNASLRLPETMELIQIIVDRDIAKFFRKSGKRINDVLRDYVEANS